MLSCLPNWCADELDGYYLLDVLQQFWRHHLVVLGLQEQCRLPHTSQQFCSELAAVRHHHRIHLRGLQALSSVYSKLNNTVHARMYIAWHRMKMLNLNLHYVGSVALIQYGSAADADGNYS